MKNGLQIRRFCARFRQPAPALAFPRKKSGKPISTPAKRHKKAGAPRKSKTIAITPPRAITASRAGRLLIHVRVFHSFRQNTAKKPCHAARQTVSANRGLADFFNQEGKKGFFFASRPHPALIQRPAEAARRNFPARTKPGRAARQPRPASEKNGDFCYWFDSAKARQTVRWRRFWGLEFAPEKRAQCTRTSLRVRAHGPLLDRPRKRKYPIKTSNQPAKIGRPAVFSRHSGRPLNGENDSLSF